MADALPRLDDTYTGLTPTSRNLCGVRLDNALSFGQTSCFYDVILVPLASWIFLLEVFIWFLPIVLSRARRAGWKDTSTLQRYDYGKRSDVRPWIQRWGKTCTFLSSLYVALIGASLVMSEYHDVILICSAVHSKAEFYSHCPLPLSHPRNRPSSSSPTLSRNRSPPLQYSHNPPNPHRHPHPSPLSHSLVYKSLDSYILDSNDDL